MRPLHDDRVAAVDDSALVPALCVPGSGSVRVSRIGSRSVVTRALASSPLRLLTPRNHGCAAWIYTSTYGGGLVDGDSVRLDVDVESGATALMATQAATKVYRSPRGTSVECDCTVHDGGLLIVAPDPVVCFAGAVYRQVQRFELEESANLVLLDWFSSGRHAAGERWKFDRYDSRVRVRCGGRLVMIDALSLDPRDGDLGQRMGRFEVMLTAAVIGPSLAAYAGEIVRTVNELPVDSRSNLLTGASKITGIAGGGCVLRIAGTSLEVVWHAAREYLTFVPRLLGDDPWMRKR
jgi:urease accessory protein